MIPGIIVGVLLAVFVVWCLVQTAKQNRKQEQYWKQVQRDNDRKVQESRQQQYRHSLSKFERFD